MRNRWSKEIIISKIQESHKVGEKLNSHYIQVNNPTLYQGAVKDFGSWEKAIKSAGFDYQKIRVKQPFRSWNKKAIVQAILKRKRCGLPITQKLVAKDDYGLYVAAKRYMGSWGKALSLAGFNQKELDPRRIWTKKRILEEIRQRWKNHQPLYINYLYKTGNSSLVSLGCKLFGSWEKAIQAAGLNYGAIRALKLNFWNKGRVLEEILNINRQGIRLNSKLIHYSKGDLFSAAIKHFGGWGQAVEAAGIDYQRHRKNWSYKTWLRNLTPKKLNSIEQQTIQLAGTSRGSERTRRTQP